MCYGKKSTKDTFLGKKLLSMGALLVASTRAAIPPRSPFMAISCSLGCVKLSERMTAIFVAVGPNFIPATDQLKKL